MEHCVCRWVPTGLQLADVLTKAMDPSLLRQTLRQGRFRIFDEAFSLERNAHRKAATAWSRSHPKREVDECEMSTEVGDRLGCEPS